MKGVLSRYRLRNTLVAAGLALVGVLLVLLYVSGYRNHVLRGGGLVAAFVAARGVRNRALRGAELVPVVVAAGDIPQGTTGADVAGGGSRQRQPVLRRNVVA